MLSEHAILVLLIAGGIHMSNHPKGKCQNKQSLLLPITILFGVLLIADLMFKGAIYKRLPIEFQKSVDNMIGK